MTEDEIARLIRPKSHWGAVVTVAIAVAGAVWGGTEFLHSRASSDDTKSLQTDVFKVRIDQTVMSGKVERIEQSQQRLEKAVERIDVKLDEQPRRRR